MDDMLNHVFQRSMLLTLVHGWSESARDVFVAWPE